MYLSDLLPSRLFMEANETMLRQAQKVLRDLKGRELDQLQAQQRAQKKKIQNNSSWWSELDFNRNYPDFKWGACPPRVREIYQLKF